MPWKHHTAHDDQTRDHVLELLKPMELLFGRSIHVVSEAPGLQLDFYVGARRLEIKTQSHLERGLGLIGGVAGI
jgi:hypothetical protein